VQINRLLFEIKCQNVLGEGVLWQSREQALYWTDIQGKALYKCAMTNDLVQMLSNESFDAPSRLRREEYLQQEVQMYELPFRLGSFAFTYNSHTLLAGFDNGLALYNFVSGELKWLSKQEVAHEHVRFNDGKSDFNGRYWLGSMVDSGDIKKLPKEQQGALYSFTFDNGQLVTSIALTGLHISNGLCFSSEDNLMYHCDSTTHKIYQYQLDDKGQIQAKKLFAKFDKDSFPDGACTDKHGNVWTAVWGGACVVCIDPKGVELFRHPLPVTQVSCVAIGGPNMNWLFVTTAQHNLSEEKRLKQPRAGNLFVYEISDSVGLTEPLINTN